MPAQTTALYLLDRRGYRRRINELELCDPDGVSWLAYRCNELLFHFYSPLVAAAAAVVMTVMIILSS